MLGAAGLSGIGKVASGNRPNKSSDQTSGKPNIVYVISDQMRPQSCGYFGQNYAGHPDPYTPNIDRLAGESLNFENAVSGYPVCAPYRNSLFTGKYPSSTGMVINELRCMPDPDAIGHVLSKHGYQTGYIGKWHLFGKYNTPKGQYTPPSPYRLGFDGYWAAYNFNHNYYDAFYYKDSFDRIDVKEYEPHTQVDLAIDYMGRAKDKDDPFALVLSMGPPHDPFSWDNVPDTFAHLFNDKEFKDPPNYDGKKGTGEYWVKGWKHKWFKNKWAPHRNRYRQVYASMISSIDWEIGRLQQAMEKMGLDENTIFVFTADHGYSFGSHGRVAKKIFYEEAVRVPFLMKWPNGIEAGRSDACINTADVAPTLLGLAGLPVPNSYEGLDLSQYITEGTGDEPEAALLQGMGHTFQWHNGDEWRGVRDKRYTYANMLADGSEYLFDNIKDPYQMNNLINDASHRPVRRRLKNFMHHKMNELNDPYKPTTWYKDNWVEDINGHRVITQSATRKLDPKYMPRNIELDYSK